MRYNLGVAKQELQTPKGFRDFLPETAKIRNFLLEKLRSSLELFGFEPLETSAIEFAETLKGKYGEEERLIFEFTDKGGRLVGLRYDQTVPLARVVASNPNLTKPFTRSPLQPVWRAENPQKGRFREFTQVDFDIVGSGSLISDAEILSAAIFATKSLGLSNFVVKINDRENFKNQPIEVVRTLDKLEKIGEDGVMSELNKFGFNKSQVKSILKKVKESPVTSNVKKLFNLLESYKVDRDKYAYDPTLARGLDYYTGIIYELEVEGYRGGSVGSGGRYDELIGKFSGSKTPAVGFSFGLDRLVETSQELGAVKPFGPKTKILVTIFGGRFISDSINLVGKLRNDGINSEISSEFEEKLDRQLKYADNKKIPYVAILGPEEIKEDKITLKNLSDGKQELVTYSELKKKLQK